MAKKISDLTPATILGDNDSFVFNDVAAGNDKRVTAAGLRNDISAEIDTVSALRSFKGKRDNQIIQLLGYNISGDGCGGLIYWDSNSTRADNGVTVFQVSGVSTGRWIRLNENADYVNLRWAGAAPGGADITDAYGLARAYAVSQRRYIFAPSGDYHYTGSISVLPDAGLIGENPSARQYDENRGTVFVANSVDARFEIRHSSFCSNFVVNANGYPYAISTERTTSGTAGVKYAVMQNLWAINFTERGYNFNDYSFNLSMYSCKTRALVTATNPISLFLVPEDSNGNPDGRTNPAIIIENPSFYGPSDTDPKGVGILARGCNAMVINGGEVVKHERSFSFFNCEVVWNCPDFEFFSAESSMEDSQVIINGGIIHTYRGDSAGYNQTNIPFTSSRRYFFRVSRSSRPATLELNSCEFRNYLGQDAGSADDGFGVVGIRQNVTSDTTNQTAVTIKNERYELGNFGSKIVSQQNNGEVSPMVQLGRNKRVIVFEKTFNGEDGDVDLNHSGGTGYYMCPNKSVVRAYFYREKGAPLANATTLRCSTYNSAAAFISISNLGSIPAAPDGNIRQGYSDMVEFEVPKNGFFKVVLNSSSFVAGTGIVIYAQVEEV